MLDARGPYENLFNYLTGYPLYFATMFYYLCACLISPGKPFENWDAYCKDSSRRWCEDCKVFKPERTFHCTRCGLCVVKRDHHCDFTNQCVGYNNHKAFLLFLVFATLGNTHYILRSFQWLFNWYFGHYEVLKAYSVVYAVGYAIHLYTMVSLWLFLVNLNLRNWPNLFLNLTWLDSYRMIIRPSTFKVYDDPPNLYNLGPYANFVQTFGTNPLSWFWPFPPKHKSLSLAPELEKIPTEVEQNQASEKFEVNPNYYRYLVATGKILYVKFR